MPAGHKISLLSGLLSNTISGLFHDMHVIKIPQNYYNLILRKRKCPVQQLNTIEALYPPCYVCQGKLWRPEQNIPYTE